MFTKKYKYTAADVLVATGSGTLDAVILTAAGDTATVTIYDETSGSGDVILKLSAVTNTTVAVSGLGLRFGVGCYLDVSGTTPAVTVVFD